MTTTCHFLWTPHARERAKERFPFLAIEEIHDLYPRTRRVGKKMRRRIKILCPAQGKWMNHGFRGRYLMVHPKAGIVYVMAASPHLGFPPSLITLFPVPGEGLPEGETRSDETDLRAAVAVLAESMTS